MTSSFSDKGRTAVLDQPMKISRSEIGCTHQVTIESPMTAHILFGQLFLISSSAFF